MARITSSMIKRHNLLSRVMIAVILCVYVLGCKERDDNSQGTSTNPDTEQLNAISKGGSAPKFGDHVLSDSQKLKCSMMSGSEVTRLRTYIGSTIGVELPENSGSFVRRRNYYTQEDYIRHEGDLWHPDDHANGHVAFMIPKDEIQSFVDHLKEQGEILNKAVDPKDAAQIGDAPFHIVEDSEIDDKYRNKSDVEILSYLRSGHGHSMGFSFVRSDGYVQTIGFLIDIIEGVVWYQSTVWDD